MVKRRRSLPPVSPRIAAELRPLVSAISEIIEVGEGVRGDPMDRKITYRDLVESGIGQLKRGARASSPGSLEPGKGPENLRVPPKPQGFAVSGGFNGLISLVWEVPGNLYSNHAHTNIYRAEEDNYANAELVGRDPGSFYTDVVRDDAEPKTYYYWISFTSTSDIEGPTNDTRGTPGKALEDTAYIIDQITGEITRSQLGQDLTSEIDQIQTDLSDAEVSVGSISEGLDEARANISGITVDLDAVEAELRGPESVKGTVAARIADERKARIAAIQDEAAERYDDILDERQAREDALAQEVIARSQALQAEADARASEISAERDARIDALIKEQGDRAAAISAEKTERVDGDTALAGQIDTLTTTVDGNSADILTEKDARADADSALASDLSSLQVRVDDNEGAILNEASVRADEIGITGLQMKVLSAARRANSATVTTLEEVRVTDHQATAIRVNSLESSVQDNRASIFNERQTRADAVSALASNVNALSAKLDALPTFSNSFELGAEFDRWTAASGHTITIDDADPFSGIHAAVVSSTEDDISTSSPPFAVAVKITSGTAEAFASMRIRLNLAIKLAEGDPAPEMAIGYATSSGWFSGWNRHTPEATWKTVESFVEVPEESGANHYIVIWGDTSGSGGSVVVDRLIADVASAELPEISAEIAEERQARVDGDEALSTEITTLGSKLNDAEASIVSEREARTSADSSLARDITSLRSEVGDNRADIVDERTTRASQNDAMAQDISGLQVSAGENSAAIQQEAQTRADETSSLSSQVNTLFSKTGDNASAIQQEQNTRSDETSALASDIQTLTTATGENAADIVTEREARSSADDAMSQDITSLYAEVDDANAEILNESKVRATEDDLLALTQNVLEAHRRTASATFYGLKEINVSDREATAEEIDGVRAQVGDTKGQIEAERRIRASEDSALSEQINTVLAKTEDNASAIVSEQTARADADSAIATDIQTLQSKTLDNEAAIQDESTARSDADSAMAQDITTLQASTGRNEAAIQDERIARADADSSMAGDIQTLFSETGDNASAIQTEKTARTDADSAMAQDISSLYADMGDAQAGIEQEAKVRADEDEVLGLIQKVMSAHRNAASATFYSMREVNVSDRESTATQVEGVRAEVEGTKAQIENEKTVRSNEVSALAQEVNTVMAETNKRVQTFFQSSQPTAEAKGDLWFDTGDYNKPSRWSGTEWVPAYDKEVDEAVGKANDAQQTADSKITSHYMASEPESPGVGDLWFDTGTGDKVSYWSGAEWKPIELSTKGEVDASITDNNRAMVGYCLLDGSVTGDETPDECASSGGSWLPAQPFAESVKQVSITDGEGALTLEQKFQAQGSDIEGLGGQYSIKLDSNGAVAGFGLASTPSDDTTNGNFSEFYVNADRFAVLPQGANKSEAVSPFIVQGNKVYIDTARIREGTIQEGQLGPIGFGKITGDNGQPVTTVSGKLKGENIEADNLHIDGNSTFAGTLDVRSSSVGSRLIISGDRIEVYNGNSLRVRIGRL